MCCFVLKGFWAICHSKVRKFWKVLWGKLSLTDHTTLVFLQLLHKLFWRGKQWRQERTDPIGSGHYLVSCTSTADAQGHGSSVTHVRIVTLWQQGNNAGTLFRGSDKKQKKWRQCYMLTYFKYSKDEKCNSIQLLNHISALQH